MALQNSLSFSRRSFLQLSAAAAAFQMVTEPMLAAAVQHRPYTKEAVFIDSNENPLGPCQAARDAMTVILPLGGRYSDNLTDEFVHTLAQAQGLHPDYIRPYAGSTPGLHFGVIAFTSSRRSYVTADPGYEAGMHAASWNGAPVVKVPLTKDYRTT